MINGFWPSTTSRTCWSPSKSWCWRMRPGAGSRRPGLTRTPSGCWKNNTYDLVVLDIMGVRGFDLLETAVKRHFRVAMLTAHALTPEALKRSYDMKAYAFLPKEKLADIVPFLEDVLKYDYATGWKRLLQKLHGFFSDRFVSDWEKKTGLEWKEWSK
ncbi:MAG: response regulator [Desulfosudis oleivorans]|nr:response regulator [Desulfosudis oleivorans]